MPESKIVMGIGKKGAYQNDTPIFVHGNSSIAHAYFFGMKVPANHKFRLLDHEGNVIAQRRNLP